MCVSVVQCSRGLMVRLPGLPAMGVVLLFVGAGIQPP